MWRKSWKRMGRTTGFGQSRIWHFGQRRGVASGSGATWPQPFLRQM